MARTVEARKVTYTQRLRVSDLTCTFSAQRHMVVDCLLPFIHIERVYQWRQYDSLGSSQRTYTHPEAPSVIRLEGKSFTVEALKKSVESRLYTKRGIAEAMPAV